MHAKTLQSCPTLWDPMNCSPPGSSSMVISRQEYWSGLPGSPLRDRTCVLRLLCWQAGSLPQAPPRIRAIGIWAIAVFFFFPPLFYKIYQMSVEAAGLGVRRNLWRDSAPWMLQPHSSSRKRLRLKQHTKLGRLSHVAGGTVPLEGNLGTSIKISSSYAQPCHF